MMRVSRQRLLLVTLGVGLISAASMQAGQPDGHPIVPGFERFYSEAATDAAAGGQLLLGELNCLSCHQSSDPGLSRKQAPILDHLGSRVRIGYLRKLLTDPHAVKPGTTMPALFQDDPERAEKVEALVHYLASTGSLKQEKPDPKLIGPGRTLYQQVGCVVCHGSRDALGDQVKTPVGAVPSVPLGDLKAKYSVPSLVSFLENPLHVRPSGRMPKLLKNKEAKEVAVYLLQGVKFEGSAGIGTSKYAYFEGNWETLPDFTKLKPVATGVGRAFDLAVAKRASDYGLKFEAFYKVGHEGNYTFGLSSDDGSMLWVDDTLVVNNDGIHPPKAEQGNVNLTKGNHKITVAFFQGGGGAELDVSVEAPGLGAHSLSDLVASSEAALDQLVPKKAASTDDELVLKPELVAKGKTLFAAVGCGSCHQLQGSPKANLVAAPLLKLKSDGGCLATMPQKGLPHYDLNDRQRTALAAALKHPPAPAKTPVEIVARTLATFNCYACHSRDKVGGPVEATNLAFLTTQQEMGDEGRLPPPLDGVGSKLTTDYLTYLLDQGAHDRPYMLTHMPGFGTVNVGHLVSAFTAADTLPSVPEVAFKEPASRVKAIGRHLSGGQAFGCIKCHTFANHKAEGVQGIDMLLMPKRLRRDWFQAYVADPPKLRPGTRMPAAFLNGKSVLPDILDGKAVTQLDAIWLYLLDGSKAQLPVGLQKQSIPLVPGPNAIIYRNFIEGAGPRAIAVGYPEKANLAFDANDLRIALLWQGAFMDAAKHWTDRGSGFENPLGDNVLQFPTGVSFALLPSQNENWPTANAKTLGFRFLGYHLTTDERPTFLYRLNEVQIEDFSSPLISGKEIGLKRTLRLATAHPVDTLYFRAAVGGKIEALADNWYRIDGVWKVKLDSGSAPVVRQSAGKSELIVPVRFVDGKAQIVEEFSW